MQAQGISVPTRPLFTQRRRGFPHPRGVRRSSRLPSSQNATEAGKDTVLIKGLGICVSAVPTLTTFTQVNSKAPYRPL